MADARDHEAIGASSRQYRRGALLGMTMAEAFILIAFALLLLLAAWKTQADREIDRYRQIEELTPEQVRVVAEMTEAGRLEEAAALAASENFETLASLEESAVDVERLAEMERSGVDVERIAEIATDVERWRLIDKDELVRILEGAQQMPEDLQRDLADLVELEDPRRIIELLEATERAPENQTMRERLAGIGAQIDAARAAEAELVATMRERLGGIVEGMGGYIDDSGAIVLRDQVLFEGGRWDVTPRMQAFLSEMCVPWMQVMMNSQVAVAGALIEGHASSEWGFGASVQDAYLNNLNLSQLRAAAVLRECLMIASGDGVPEDVETWARAHLRAVGFSSARLVLDENGEEIPEQSRRVVFRIDFDQERLIRDLEGEVLDSLLATEQPQAQERRP
jgi:outer membrane protein OmpA-like peptidoglycan-associated protein